METYEKKDIINEFQGFSKLLLQMNKSSDGKSYTKCGYRGQLGVLVGPFNYSRNLSILLT